MDVFAAREKGAIKESHRVEIGPLQYFTIEYPTGESEQLQIFLRSKDCFYRLHAPNKGYKEVFKGFLKKVNVTRRILQMFQETQGECGMVELAKHGKGIQLDELAEHGDFIMAELQAYPDERVKNSSLVAKELPEFLKRYQRDNARIRTGAKLHEANKAIMHEMKRVEQDTLDFFTKHWNVVKAFATGLPKAIAERLSSGTFSIESAEQKDREDQILEALDLIVGTPSYIQFSTMRDYQVEGLRWMVDKYMRGLRGMILADEMGLGKTLQSISFIGHLRFVLQHTGPFLVLAPLSTLPNWQNEFERWCPDLRVVKYHGNKQQRDAMKREALVTGKFDVCITNYESARSDESVLANFVWRVIVMDEAHRIKNENAQQTLACMRLRTQHVLLLTGTPLQNNLHELWVLLKFMFPNIFPKSDAFDAAYNPVTQEYDQELLTKTHTLLMPFFLRRVKSDLNLDLPDKKEVNVFLPLSKLQTECYRSILTGEVGGVLQEVLKKAGGGGTLSGHSGDGNALRKLMHLVMQCRKACNHPYLFDGMEPEPYINGEHLIEASSKFVFLDKFLPKLEKDKHRVLIYSQFTSMLDILEDFCSMRQFRYLRLDGSTHSVERQMNIDRFNQNESDVFIFLLSTRAGGLGINLATADTVILFDSDWNPQRDLQAMDRAHRLGQTKQVMVYRLITKGTVEERIIMRAAEKLFLDAMIVQQATRAQSAAGNELLEKHREGLTTNDLLGMLTFGAERMFESDGVDLRDEDLDALLDRSTKYEENAKESIKSVRQNAKDFSIEKAKAFTTYLFQGEDMKEQVKRSRSESTVEKWAREADGKARESKKRVVMMDGGAELGQVPISVSSIRDVEKAEREEKMAGVEPVKRQREWVHESECFKCKEALHSKEEYLQKEAGKRQKSVTLHDDEVMCALCPKSFHLKCVDLDERPHSFPPWKCPWHSCAECHNTSTQAGGFMFRCRDCPTAYCGACKPPTVNMLGKSLEPGLKTNLALYILCEKCDV